MAIPGFRRRADLLLVTVDVVIVIMASALAFFLRFEGEPRPPGSYIFRYEIGTAILVAFWVTAGRLVGLYDRRVLRPGSDLVHPTFRAAVWTGLGILVANVVVLQGMLSRGWIGLVVLGLLLLGLGSRRLLSRLRRALVPLGVALERYAILGDDAAGIRLHAHLTRAAGAPFIVTELLPGDMESSALARRAKQTHLDGLIVPAGPLPEQAPDIVAALSDQGMEVLLAANTEGLQMRVLGLTSLHGAALLRVAGLNPRRRAMRQTGERDLRNGVALIGTRGVPANYGGFETFAEHLALHLVEVGIPVTVYCRRHHATQAGEWRGIRLVTLPTVKSKYLDTVLHTTLSVVHLILRTRIRDVVLCNAANGPVLPLLRIAAKRTLMNVDGMEWRRGKWGPVGRAWYHLGEWMAVRWASVLITDAEEVRTYYRARHDADSVMVSYGADLLERGLPLSPDVEVLAERFLLYVSRWERENNPVMVASAHAVSGLPLPLVMLGEATYDTRLTEEVKAAAGPNAIFPGSVYGDGYRRLLSNALAYVHATEVGGTHPALIEAMAAGNLCLVLDTPENREVAGDVAWLFADGDELTKLLRDVANLTTKQLEELRERTRAHAATRYSWSAVGDAYVKLLSGSG